MNRTGPQVRRYTAELSDPAGGEVVVVSAGSVEEAERLIDAAFGLKCDPAGRELDLVDQ